MGTGGSLQGERSPCTRLLSRGSGREAWVSPSLSPSLAHPHPQVESPTTDLDVMPTGTDVVQVSSPTACNCTARSSAERVASAGWPAGSGCRGQASSSSSRIGQSSRWSTVTWEGSGARPCASGSGHQAIDTPRHKPAHRCCISRRPSRRCRRRWAGSAGSSGLLGRVRAAQMGRPAGADLALGQRLLAVAAEDRFRQRRVHRGP